MTGADYLTAAAFGSVFGASELLTRYRDNPAAAMRTAAGIVYVGINAVVAATGLAAAHLFDWTFGVAGPADQVKVRATQVIVTGFGSMAVLRSAIFNVRAGTQDVGIGFNAIVQAFLRAADSAVDRRRGIARDVSVRAMDRVSFAKAAVVLPSYCLGLMQNLTPEDETALARRIEAVSQVACDDVTKGRLLGLAIINVMGEKVLLAAIESLGDRITR